MYQQLLRTRFCESTGFSPAFVDVSKINLAVCVPADIHCILLLLITSPNHGLVISIIIRCKNEQVSIKGTVDYGLRTTDYGLRTTDYGLRLRTTEYGLRTTDYGLGMKHGLILAYVL